MNKRVLPVVLVASCLVASAAARAADSSTPANNPTDAVKTDVAKGRCYGACRARAARRLFRHGQHRDPKRGQGGPRPRLSAFNEAKPIVMILTGTADRTGDAAVNLELYQCRAVGVLQGLLARGIPADRFQVLAKGETELPVPTNEGVAELQNRRVEITWR
jgi:hypothetical protein